MFPPDSVLLCSPSLLRTHDPSSKYWGDKLRPHAQLGEFLGDTEIQCSNVATAEGQSQGEHLTPLTWVGLYRG